ncbi:MAG: hypothetical protein KF890_11610 [Nitrospira sp.]|nr:hypothetical protein [Nitrospira sp.]
MDLSSNSNSDCSSSKSHNSAGSREVGSARGRGCGGGILQRVWEASEAGPDLRDDHRAAATGAGPGGALCQSDAATVHATYEAGGRVPPPAVSAWIGAGRFRVDQTFLRTCASYETLVF